jgi:DNA-binding SARP family transcriptional activator
MPKQTSATDGNVEKSLGKQPALPAVSMLATHQARTSSTPPALVIRALGSFSVRGLHGTGLGEADSRQHAKALIALAASARTGVARDEAVEALWPNHAETAARNRLYHTMHLVRRSLSALAWPGDWIVLNQGRVQLDVGIDSDAARLNEACAGSLASISDASLLQILQLCRGDWAPDVDAGNIGDTLRRHMRECHIAVLREAASRQAAHGDTPARRDMLRQLLQINPTDEWVYRQCMQLDLDAARPHAVLRTFEAAGRELAQQLGLKPSAVLGELAWSASRQLEPADPSGEKGLAGSELLIGREHDVCTLVALLSAQAGVWNVHGVSGVGKSALMREVARRSALIRRDGVHLVSLRDCDDVDAVVSVLLRTCGSEQPQGDPRAVLLDMVRTKDVLLILDDCDAMPGCQAVVDFFGDLLQARTVLVTKTPIAGLQVQRFDVKPLALAEAEASIEEVQLSPAVMLFQMHRVNDDLHTDPAVASREVLELVRHIGGLPLAIEQAARRTVTLTPGEILQRLRHPERAGLADADRGVAVAAPAIVVLPVDASSDH